MAMVCPQCSTTYEQRLQCPTCNTRLLYRDLRGGRRRFRPGGKWQHTPWGRIFIGLLMSQGLFYGLRQLLSGVLLALQGDGGSEATRALYDMAVIQALQILTLLLGCILAGAGQRGGVLLGAVVGVWNGVLAAMLVPGPGQALSAMSLYVQPMLHTVFGAVGGWIGCLVWKPVPHLTVPGASQVVRKPVQVRRRTPLFAGRVAWLRVLAGAALAVAGTLSANAMFQFLLEHSGGKLNTPAEIQDRVFTWEIKALALFLGGALAGATTANGLKQGLYVGLFTSLVLVGFQAQSAAGWAEVMTLTAVSVFTMTLVGGWFGSQLFPPVVPFRSTRGIGPASA